MRIKSSGNLSCWAWKEGRVPPLEDTEQFVFNQTLSRIANRVRRA